MTSSTQQPTTNWKDRAIQKAESITDAWDVFKNYAGRFADWILFGCMIINIIEMLGFRPEPLVNVTLGVQVVTLDVAGFGLSSMAEHAIRMGNKGGQMARWVSYFLITLTIITLVNVQVGNMFRDAQWTGAVDNTLILIRIGMTVVYGFVVHSLRDHGPVLGIQALRDANEALTRTVEELQQQTTNLQ